MTTTCSGTASNFGSTSQNRPQATDDPIRPRWPYPSPHPAPSPSICVRPSFRDRWSRTCDVSLPLENDAPGVWRLEVGKSGWARSGVIELREKLGVDALAELGRSGGTLRVYGLGALETTHGTLTHAVQHFEGTLQARTSEEPVRGRPESDKEEADCLEFDVQPTGTGTTGTGGGTGTAPAGGARVDYTADMRIHPELEKSLLRTDGAASALGDSLAGAAKGYLEYCLEYLAITPPGLLKDDDIFERRLKRVPIFLEGTNNITQRAENAVDVRSAVMKRITANMLDFLIEIAFIGLGFATDFWKAAGRRPGRLPRRPLSRRSGGTSGSSAPSSTHSPPAWAGKQTTWPGRQNGPLSQGAGPSTRSHLGSPRWIGSRPRQPG